MNSFVHSPHDLAEQWRRYSPVVAMLVLCGIGLPAIRWSARRFERRRIGEGRWDENGPTRKLPDTDCTTEVREH